MSCTWCGAEVERDAGFRCYEPAGERAATFCRLEHIVAWGLRGAHWEPAPGPVAADPPETCSFCGEPPPDTFLIVIRARGEARVLDGFCSVDHLVAWAKAGGRYARW